MKAPKWIVQDDRPLFWVGRTGAVQRPSISARFTRDAGMASHDGMASHESFRTPRRVKQILANHWFGRLATAIADQLDASAAS